MKMTLAILLLSFLGSAFAAHAEEIQADQQIECRRPGKSKMIVTMTFYHSGDAHFLQIQKTDFNDIKLIRADNGGRQRFKFGGNNLKGYQTFYGEPIFSESDYVGINGLGKKTGIQAEIVIYNVGPWETPPPTKTKLECEEVPAGTLYFSDSGWGDLPG